MTGGFGDASISFGATTITRTYPAAAPQLALYLVQYSPSNVVTWSKTIGSPTQGVWGYCIALASCGQVWVSGNYNEKAVIDIGDTLALVTGRDPIFIAGYNLSGGTIGYSGLGAGGDDQNGIACDASGNVFICSDYSGTLTIGPDLLKGSILTEEFYIGKYVNTTTPPDSVIGLDTIKCIGSTGMTLTAPPGYTVYFWDDGSSLSSRFVTTAGKYYVYCITCGLPMLIDTFIVLPDAGIPPSVVTSAKDTSACSSVGAITLNVPAGYNADLWSTGSTAASIVVTSAGSYWIQCTRNCVILSDTFKVTFTPSPVVSLDNDTGFCSGNSITLTSAQPPGYTYLWNTGSISNSINVSQRGLYWLTVNNNGCIATDSINIAELFPPPPVNLGPDTVLCLDNILQLSAQAGTSPLSWSNGSNEQNMTVTETGTYWATLSNACGITSDTIKVDFEPCELWFPSAFTPNGDGRNDIIRVVGYLRFYKDFSLSIFNRFGQRVFFTEDINSGWDGNFNGSKQDLGTYFYLIYYSLEGK